MRFGTPLGSRHHSGSPETGHSERLDRDQKGSSFRTGSMAAGASPAVYGMYPQMAAAKRARSSLCPEAPARSWTIGFAAG